MYTFEILEVQGVTCNTKVYRIRYGIQNPKAYNYMLGRILNGFEF